MKKKRAKDVCMVLGLKGGFCEGSVGRNIMVACFCVLIHALWEG